MTKIIEKIVPKSALSWTLYQSRGNLLRRAMVPKVMPKRDPLAKRNTKYFPPVRNY